MTRALALALVAMTIAGCATLMVDHTEVITIHSEPSGAQVFVQGRAVGVTPLRVPVSNHERFKVFVALPGRRTQVCEFTVSGRPGYLLVDVLTPAFVGLLVDLVRGEWRTLDQTHCVVWFEPPARRVSEASPAGRRRYGASVGRRQRKMLSVSWSSNGRSMSSTW